MTEPLKISIVSYTNTLPFRWALKHSSLRHRIDLQEDIPSVCALKLKTGVVDLALVPVALLPELDRYHIETNYCIGADGKVDSVKLYSDVPIEKIKTVVLDYQSKSSITLTRVLFRNYWKKEVRFVDAAPGFENSVGGEQAVVVIGDRTFGLNGKHAFEYDLAETWKDFTGLPFVFAAWVSRDQLDTSFISEFNTCLQHGVHHIRESVEGSMAPAALAKDEVFFYLTERIDYKLDQLKREALERFLGFIKEL